MITVYGAPPSRAVRVLWMLEEMGLDYRVRPVDLLSRDKDDEFLEASPAGLLPAIEDGPARMFESVAIMEYLAARHGPTPLAPAAADPAYPLYQQFLHFGEASLAGPLNLAIAARFFAPEAEKANWGSELAVRMVVKRCAMLDRQLQRSAFMAGDRFTAADISCAYALHLLRALGRTAGLPASLDAYWDRVTARPAYARAMRHLAPLMGAGRDGAPATKA